ncbi:C40 family peptidase [Curtobacterium caseinilyticum]|uniref:C40 family peptidase n=1 Tax=Curtobacterium caseinilyticum TaxID=3055137 RepID=A0ABT7TW64_9MICO|nr:C40 family peptidase [Curtobacterium caseinilyticum]MDM7893177.1 C40 family peptidase [Curtobacterium caseinilyticum]
MGRHALPAAPDGEESAAPEPTVPAEPRRPRGRRAAHAPDADHVVPVDQAHVEQDRAVPTRAEQARAVPTRAEQARAVPTRAEQDRAVQDRASQTRAVSMVAVPVSRPVASTAVAGSAVLSRSAVLRAERAADPRHVRRAVNAKRAAILLAPALAVTSSLTLALPANAAPAPSAPSSSSTIAGYDAQSFTVARDVEVPVVQTDGMTTTTTIVSYPTIVTKYGVTTQQAEAAISKVLSAGGKRATIVSTALQYMGDPYVEGGASHSGIDCSGLTMVAYAAVGIPLVHYVPSQDAVATRITQAEALPGDLVVFDNEDHVGIYLGDGIVLQAPHPGDPVDIVPLYPNAHHFARLLPAGE